MTDVYKVPGHFPDSLHKQKMVSQSRKVWKVCTFQIPCHKTEIYSTLKNFYVATTGPQVGLT